MIFIKNERSSLEFDRNCILVPKKDLNTKIFIVKINLSKNKIYTFKLF